MKDEDVLLNDQELNQRRNNSVGAINDNNNGLDYNVENIENEVNNQNNNNNNGEEQHDNNENHDNNELDQNLNINQEQEHANEHHEEHQQENEQVNEEVNNENNVEEENAVNPNVAEIDRLKKEQLRLKREQDELRRRNEELEAENALLKGQAPKKKGKLKEIKDDRTAEDKGYKPQSGDDKFANMVTDQAGKVNRLKHLTRKMTLGVVGPYGQSSSSYRKIAKDLNALDQFMKEIDGRTNLTAEEMETYDKLSLNVYRSSKEYLLGKAMANTVEADEEGIDVMVGTDEVHMSPKNEYERTRIRTIEKIQNDIQAMREEMFANQIAAKKDEMNKSFDQGKMEEELAREQMVGKDANAELKSSMEQSVAKTLFYDNRIKSLENSNDFTVKPGETFVGAMNRLDKSVTPTEDDINNILETDQAQKIVEAGLAKQKEGKGITTAEIQEAIKAGEMKQGDAIREQNHIAQNQRNINNPQAQKKDPVLGQNQPAPM
jgi:hypothetical protein